MTSRTTRSRSKPVQVMPSQETSDHGVVEPIQRRHSKRRKCTSSQGHEISKDEPVPSVSNKHHTRKKRSSIVGEAKETSNHNPSTNGVHIPFLYLSQSGPLANHILVQVVTEEQLRLPMFNCVEFFAKTIENHYHTTLPRGLEFEFHVTECIRGSDLTGNDLSVDFRTNIVKKFTRLPLSTILGTIVERAETQKKGAYDDVIVLGINAPMNSMTSKEIIGLRNWSPWECYQRLVHTKVPVPSTAAKSSTYATLQAVPDTAIYDGRRVPHQTFETVAPPIYHYHPIFSDFFQFIEDAPKEMTKEHLRKTQKFMVTAAFIVPSENKRMPLVWRCLDEIIGTTIHSEKNLDETASDALEFQVVNGIRIPILNGEGKRENGEGGSDASIQAGCSTRRIWLQHDKTTIRNCTNCPTFILAAGGPWFCIMGGVITNQVIVQRLTAMEWLVCSSTAEDHRVYKMARVLWALRKVLQKLKGFYKALEPTLQSPITQPPLNDTNPRFYPSPTTFLMEGHKITFSYLRPLEGYSTCVTYQARIVNTPIECQGLPFKIGDTVVVKFVTRYGKTGHEFLAKRGLAPALYYVGEVPDWKWAVRALRSEVEFPGLDFGSSQMVVMEFVEACDVTYERNQELALQVARILNDIHSAGFVFGDLRPPNMLYYRNQVMLIDFNWMGRFDIRNLDLTGVPPVVAKKIKGLKLAEEGNFATFPLNVNTAIFGEENLGLEPIHPRHDWKMWSSTFCLDPTLAAEILLSLT